MFDVFIYTDRDALHWKRKSVLSDEAYSITVEEDRGAYICEGILKTVANSNAYLDMAIKIQRGRLFVQKKRIWTTNNIRRDDRACS